MNTSTPRQIWVRKMWFNLMWSFNLKGLQLIASASSQMPSNHSRLMGTTHLSQYHEIGTPELLSDMWATFLGNKWTWTTFLQQCSTHKFNPCLLLFAFHMFKRFIFFFFVRSYISKNFIAPVALRTKIALIGYRNGVTNDQSFQISSYTLF
jgi:hypothetical protein